jgi:hypothetical protein
MDSLNQILKGLKGLEKETNQLMNQSMTPEIMDQLNPAQKAMINEAKSAFNLDGLSLAEKEEKLRETLKRYGS